MRPSSVRRRAGASGHVPWRCGAGDCRHMGRGAGGDRRAERHRRRLGLLLLVHQVADVLLGPRPRTAPAGRPGGRVRGGTRCRRWSCWSRRHGRLKPQHAAGPALEDGDSSPLRPTKYPDRAYQAIAAAAPADEQNEQEEEHHHPERHGTSFAPGLDPIGVVDRSGAAVAPTSSAAASGAGSGTGAGIATVSSFPAPSVHRRRPRRR